MKALFKTSAIIITAGGSGTRLDSKIKKQYIKLSSKPVLYYSLKFFDEYQFKKRILVLPAEDIDYVKKNIIEKYNFNDYILIAGGETRHHSVFNGLNAVQKCRYVFIHDGVRPFVTKKIMSDIIKKISTKKYQGIIPCIKIKDTIKLIDDKSKQIIKTINRENYRAVQTPQAFNFEILYNAYKSNVAKLADFTDDSGILEEEGIPVFYVDGDNCNIKITTPEDLAFAEIILKKLLANR